MNKIRIRPKKDIEEYLRIGYFNIDIYKELTENKEWIGVFEPLEFLNLLYEQYTLVKANTTKPLSVKIHFQKMDFSKRKLYYLLYNLKRLVLKECSKYNSFELSDINQIHDPQLKICFDFIEEIFTELEKELFPGKIKQIEEAPYDFDNVKKHLETLPGTSEKIKYLYDIYVDHKQNRRVYDDDNNFSKKCELEIEKLKELSKLGNDTIIKPNKTFQLSDKKGAKIDLIRILNAVYELKLIKKQEGQYPSKEYFMKQTGDFFGVDLSKYDVDLSQALNNSSLETNLKVFEDMKDLTQKSHYIGRNKNYETLT